MVIRTLRPAMALGAGLLAIVFAAQPAAAATVLSTTGTVGNYAFQDNQNSTRGADCDYATSKTTHHGVTAFWLHQLKVRGPKVYAYNNGSGTRQWVGWQFKVQNEPASSTNAWTTVSTSSVVKAHATIGTGIQFAARTWTAPASLPNNTNWRVIVVVNWYKRPGSTAVGGSVKASYDYYHVKGGGATVSPPEIRNTDCYVNN
jgi:hypothetical protein